MMGKRELYIKGLAISWDRMDTDSYLRSIPAIASCESLVFRKPVTCFVGENGSVKSTLLEAIAVAYGFNPEGGTRNYSFSTYDSHSELSDAIRSWAQWEKDCALRGSSSNAPKIKPD